MFDEKGLELPESYIKEIDEKLDFYIDYDANGSKTQFNTILADFGVNYKLLREAYIMEAKIEYLEDELFGADGSKLSPNLFDEYLRYTFEKQRREEEFKKNYIESKFQEIETSFGNNKFLSVSLIKFKFGLKETVDPSVIEG